MNSPEAGRSAPVGLDAKMNAPDSHDYDDMCEWVGRVRLLTWTLRDHGTNVAIERFTVAVRSGRDVTVDVWAGPTDYTVIARVGGVRPLWGAPSFRTLREAQAVVRELHDFVREVKLLAQTTASGNAASIGPPSARATVTSPNVCKLLGDILHHGVIDQPDVKIGVRPFMAAIKKHGLPSPAAAVESEILETFSDARAAVDELVRQREFGLRNGPRCRPDEQGACDCYDFDALRVLWPGQETSTGLTEPANGAR